MAILFKGGRLADPFKEEPETRDVLIENGRISRIVPSGTINEKEEGLEVIDISGKILAPGLIDMHVHLREPGHEYKETIASGSLAGVSGGYTGLACMPNTEPANDSRSVTEFILKQARDANLARIYPIASITKGRKGEVLTEFGELKMAGAVGVSDDGSTVKNSELMRRALEYAKYHGLTVISHCEDEYLSGGGSMHEGTVSTKIGLKGIPSACEEIMVTREILLSRLTGCPVHIAHVSTWGSVKAIRAAKEEGLSVTAETTPHYFSLNHNAVIGYNTNAKMNPPLRTEKDVEAIKSGLADGIIDAIATDHAPHSPLEKELEFDRAQFGIIGLETAVPLTLNLVREGRLSLINAIRKLTVNPAKILGVEGGSIAEGEMADLCVIDPEVEYLFSEQDIHSKSRNSPFLGKKLKGRNILTMIEGRIVWSR